ncbi:sugar transferase [Paenibacillus sp. An7]|uniref:sugar transferase n=1 Tax=Paenibacillus sp. An7 TaxID=2689577 RepID=UPI0013585426|nr:sugar transferase [Paenibacillus sp. An7]
MSDNQLNEISASFQKENESLIYTPEASGKNLYSVFTKPFIDYFVSIICLICLSPLMLLLSVMIKLDSKGPVIFKQERYGKEKKIFRIYKFRTMYTDAPKYALSPTSSEDPRITRVGKFLRKTSMDELPQLLNILKGDMSFIGPRPELRNVVEEVYSDLEFKRLAVKPGITGTWQVSNARKEPIHHNLQYDFNYIENISLKSDCMVIIRTLKILVKSNTF